MRAATRLSLKDAAQKLAVSRSALDRMEHGEAAVTLPIAQSMMQLYDQFDPSLLELARQARQPGWWAGYRVANSEYLAWETCAASVFEFAPTRIPELLRTEQYAHAALVADTEQIRDDHAVRRMIRDGLSARFVRQYRFVDKPVLRLRAVITETALRQEVGSRQVMLTQWMHLRWAMSWAAVTVQILPAAMTPPTLHGLRLLEFADSGEPARLFRDRAGNAVGETAVASVVERAYGQLDRLAAASLSVAESAAFVQRLIREVGTRELNGRQLAELMEWASSATHPAHLPIDHPTMRKELS